MPEAYICDYIRTPIGRFGGQLASVRADDLGAVPLKALMERNAGVDWAAVDDVVYGCANQAGEDNRNVARMALLLAGLPKEVSGTTVNRLCGSGMDAVTIAARAIKAGEAELMIAGGVESMSRAPFVLPKADSAFSRNAEIYDTTIGWRFVNPLMKKQYGVDSMPETGENVAEDFAVSRADQDAFAVRSQAKAAAAQENGRLAKEIVPVTIPQRKGDPVVVSKDEHPRATSIEALAKLPTPFRQGGTVTAGNASGVNDGAAALIIASEAAAKKYGLTPIARILGGAAAGVRRASWASARCRRRRNSCRGSASSRRTSMWSSSTKPSRRRASPCSGNSGSPRTPPTSIRMAAQSRSAIRSACRAPASPARRRWSFGERGTKRALATMCIGVGQGIALALQRD